MLERFRYTDIVYERAVTTPPAGTAISIAEVRERLRLGSEDADADITLMIGNAEAWWEADTGTSLMPQVVELRLDKFPARDKEIPLMHSPIRAVNSVKYLDEAGVQQTWMADKYQVELAGGRLLRLESWPTVQSERISTVAIEMDVGYANAAAVPADVKIALLLRVGDTYRWREDTQDARTRLMALPYGAQTIAERYRRVWFQRPIK